MTSPRPAPSPAGLLVATGGALLVTDEAGTLVPFDGPVGTVRSVSTGGGRIVATTVDAGFMVSDVAAAGTTSRVWRALTVKTSDAGQPLIGALSHDGGHLAVVEGGPEAPPLRLQVVDLATGFARVHRIDLAANGGVAWIDGAALALEVLGADRQSTIATVDVATGAARQRRANGLSLSATADGRRLAVIEVVSGLAGVHDTTGWLDGVAGADPPLPTPAGSLADRVALSADGARAAIVASDRDGRRILVLAALRDGRWQTAGAIPLPDDGPVSISWLD